jgi:tight adherence protein B
VTSATAVLLAAAAGALLVPDRARRLHRLRSPVPREARPTGLGLRVAAVTATITVALVTGAALLTLSAGVAVATAVRAASRRARRRRAEAVRAAVLDLLTGLAAELRAGSQPRAALAVVSSSAPALLAPVAAAARSPVADPAAALALVAGKPGAAALADLGVAWRVVADTGAGLAGVVDRVASGARADDAVRREVAAQVAGPRATAALLAGLPLAGVGLGAALGADPLGFLLGDRPGRICLLAGVVLVAAGTAWTDTISARAEPPP